MSYGCAQVLKQYVWMWVGHVRMKKFLLGSYRV